jgi:putative ABC transport system permease protein
VSATYFDVLGVRLLRGRTFDSRDRASSGRVAVINDAIAREYFPGADPVGQRICVGDPVGKPGEKNPWRTIIGVVANEKGSRNYHQIGWIERAQVFKPVSQDPPGSVSLVVHGPGSDLRHAIVKLDSGVAIGDVGTMQGRLGKLLAYPRFRAILLGGFAGFALLLAAIGLYGVLGQFVSQRTPEIGVRMAVGARPADVLRLIVLEAAGPVAAGVVAGMLGAAGLGRYLGSLLYEIRPGDPMILGLVSVALVCVAGLATLLPARRAARVDPMAALRAE